MKDYERIGKQIFKIVRCNYCQLGVPTIYHQINLHINICEPYIIGYNFYVAYSFNRWSIDYTLDPSVEVRVDMDHIYGIKTDKEMLSRVENIVNTIRKKCGVSK